MADCQMEILYMDPTAYTAVSNHKMRQAILGELFRSYRKGNRVTKQDLADALDIKYQQLVYQLSNHLRDFWTVIGEKKIRGTRMEYIAPSNPHGIYICLGKDHRIYMADPLADIYGPLDEVGLRCDKCSVEEAEHCIAFLVEKNMIEKDLSIPERGTLSANKRSGLRPLDRGIIEALKGAAFGDRCVLTIPCEICSFMNRHNIVMID